jgi:uncharacterized membrane protein YGL010W
LFVGVGLLACDPATIDRADGVGALFVGVGLLGVLDCAGRHPTGGHSEGRSVFVVGWALQFAGHAIEGKPPEFLKDWRFLLVGTQWWAAKMRGKV